MSKQFEVSGGPNFLGGDLYHANIHEVTSPTMPTNIIRTDQDWFVHLQWRLTGSLVPLIGGTWLIQTYLESIGPGPEFEVNAPGMSLAVNPNSPNYDVKFHVQAGAVPEGSYQMVTTIKFRDQTGRPGPLTGFYEEPIVEFYKA